MKPAVLALLAVAFSAPAAGVAIWSSIHTVSEILDPNPCVRWEGIVRLEGGGYHGSATLGPNDPCKSISIRGSKRRAATIMALVPGGVLLSALLGIMGAALKSRWLLLAGGFLMLAETLVVFTIAPLTLIAGLGFFYLVRRMCGPAERTPGVEPGLL